MMNWEAFGVTFVVVFFGLCCVVGLLLGLVRLTDWLERFSPAAAILIMLGGIALFFALGAGITG